MSVYECLGCGYDNDGVPSEYRNGECEMCGKKLPEPDPCKCAECDETDLYENGWCKECLRENCPEEQGE